MDNTIIPPLIIDNARGECKMSDRTEKEVAHRSNGKLRRLTQTKSRRIVEAARSKRIKRHHDASRDDELSDAEISPASLAQNTLVLTERESDSLINNELNISSSTIIDLKKLFPVSRRYVIKEMLPWLMGFIFLFGLYWLNFGASIVPLPSIDLGSAFSFLGQKRRNLFAFDEVILYGSAAIILTVTCCYHELQRRFFQYRIEGFRILIKKGLVFVEEGSLPLLPIAEVYARRGPLDLILGLSQVHIAVPVDSVKSFARIEGLSRRNANALIDFLSTQLSRQTAVPQAPQFANISRSH